jgi:transposase
MEAEGEPTVRPFSNDLRLRIHEARQAGESTAEVAERFGVSTAFVRRLEQRFRQSGSLAPRPGGRGRAGKLAGREQELRQAVRDHPDATPAEHRDRLNLPASRVTVWRTLRRLRLTRKKKSTHAAEQDRPDVAEARRRWPEKVSGVAPEDLVFLDETGANTAMRRTHGYAPQGERVVAAAPLGGWRTVTFVGALTAGGLVAPWALEGAMNGEWFLAYVKQVLAPALRPGMVVVMDNLPCHKVAGVEEAIRSAGCRLEYLPPYSPDLNPIENAFSKLKRALRDWAARSVEGVYEGLRRLIPSFRPAECLNYFRHCGYAIATAA